MADWVQYMDVVWRAVVALALSFPPISAIHISKCSIPPVITFQTCKEQYQLTWQSFISRSGVKNKFYSHSKS